MSQQNNLNSNHRTVSLNTPNSGDDQFWRGQVDATLNGLARDMARNRSTLEKIQGDFAKMPMEIRASIAEVIVQRFDDQEQRVMSVESRMVQMEREVMALQKSRWVMLGAIALVGFLIANYANIVAFFTGGAL